MCAYARFSETRGVCTYWSMCANLNEYGKMSENEDSISPLVEGKLLAIVVRSSRVVPKDILSFVLFSSRWSWSHSIPEKCFRISLDRIMGTKWECAGASSATCLEMQYYQFHMSKVIVWKSGM